MKHRHLTKCRLIVFLALLGLVQSALARKWYFNDHISVGKKFTMGQPYIEFEFPFFDGAGSITDSYFDGTPVFQINGYNAFLTELKCTEENGTDHGAKGVVERGNGSWLDPIHTITVGETTFRIRCYNPRKDDGGFYKVTVVVVPDKIKPGDTFTFGFWGRWVVDRGSTESKSWATKESMPNLTMAMEDTSVKSTRPSPDQVNIHLYTSGVGHTMTHATNGKRVQPGTDLSKLTYVDPSSLKSRATSSGQQGASDITLGLEQGAFDATNSENRMLIQCSYEDNSKNSSVDQLGKTIVYKWYQAEVPGYGKATDVNATPNQWKQQIMLNWKYSGDSNRAPGSWTVLRKKKGEADSQYQVLLNRSNATNYTDTGADYDTDYQYMIAFIPKGTDTGIDYHKTLSNTVVDACIKRDIPIKITSLMQKGDDKIAINWTSCALQGNEKYEFIIYRALCTEDNDGTHPGVDPVYLWNKVGSVTVTSKEQTEFSFVDQEGLETCKSYYYKVELTAMDNNVFSSGEGADMKAQSIGGKSAVNKDEVNASKGEYTGTVKVTWTATQVGTGATKYEVARRLMGSNTWSKVYNVSGTSTNYYYEDNTALPGNYYQYRVRSFTECGEDGQSTFAEGFSDGFCRSTGTISGRVSYDQGTAVAGTKVILTRSEGDADADSTSTGQFRSMLTTGYGSGITYRTQSDEDRKALSHDFALQMMVRVGDDLEQETFPYIFYVGDGPIQSPLSLRLQYKKEDGYNLRLGLSGMPNGYIYPDFRLRPNEFNAITVLVQQDTKKVTFALTYADGTTKKAMWTVDQMSSEYQNIASISFGSILSGNLVGNLDDIRVFAGESLDLDAILASQDHPLNGSEKDLFLYWPLDEGITNQATAYDYSRTNGVANGRHGQIVNCSSSTTVPTTSQFSLYAVTDSQGNYTLRGVPFSGDGTTYKITPTMGVHSFSPIYSSRFVSGSALVYSGVDFTDNSSFPVSGKVRYSGTTIPVEGCMVYVDGQAASKNGKVVKTESDGTFTVSVPIGKHYIELKKEGHTMEQEGRYPADPQGIGKTFLCEEEIKNVTFWDSTLVNFTGHIVGGKEQAGQPVGFGLSHNNIGRTRLTLVREGTGSLNAVKNENNGTISYDPNSKQVALSSQTSAINSRAYRGAGDEDDRLFIITDSLTGEFSAMLPPLKYQLESVNFLSQENPEAGKSLFERKSIDLSDPLQTRTDTAMVDGKKLEYEYHTALKNGWYTPAVFSVKQKDNSIGAFGVDSYTVSDVEGSFTVPVYTQSGDTAHYEYDHPIFLSQEKYTLQLKAFEAYVNYDEADPETGKYPCDTVPLSGTTVTISNALSANQTVYAINNDKGGKPGTVVDLKTNTIELDSLGEFTYTWMAGLPNLTIPHTRALQFYYEAGGATNPWRAGGLEGIILGSMPTGNNFVTQGPELIDMILRDPPGTASSATWTKGSTVSHFKSHGSVWDSDTEVGMNYKLGLQMAVLTGWGVMVETTTTQENDTKVGVKATTEGENANSFTRTVTTERTISTSAEPEYVGARGDVFVGSSTNIIFGDAREVALVRANPGEQTAKLDQRDITTTGLSFDTEFQYSANYIENVLLPNLHKVRNGWLTRVPVGTAKDFVNTGDTTLYITELDPEDLRYGSDNDDQEAWGDKACKRVSSEGPSYRMVKSSKLDPNSKEKEADQIMLFNQSISNWISHLTANERHKVRAFEKRDSCIKHNLSFDAGSSVTMTQTTDTTMASSHEITTKGLVHLSLSAGVQINGFGFSAYTESTTGGGTHDQEETSATESATFSYTLAETGDDDAISVDVYDDGAFAPIFRTRGGQTSGPYEGEVVTSYFEPGQHIIMDATQQIEVPEITVDNLKWSMVSNIPSGGAANYTLRLRNNSETGEDVYYMLLATDDNNGNGAKISIDGKVLTGDGRMIKIPATETIVKTLQLEQTNQSVLRYDSIAIVLASQTQYDPTSTWDQIADTVYLSAEFAPSSSDVHMALDKSVINTITRDTLSITFNQFDRTYSGLKCFRVQALQPGGTDWTTLREYTLAHDPQSPNAEELPEESSVTYTYDMHGLSDGNYRFRVLSVSEYGGKEITRESNEVAITKDMVKPKPLGTPQPSGGILGLGDDISLTFNEEIVKGALTEDDNFEITAVLNGTQVEHGTALSMQDEQLTATTEAAIPLAGKSFSTDMWLLASGAGTILSHGNGTEKFALSLDDDLHLCVGVGSDTHTSTEALPRDSWCYLTVSYEARDGEGIVNASVSEASTTTALLTECHTAAYHGTGTLSVGERMAGAMHELTLWDVAHDNAKAQEERQRTKAPSTAHLIGYWKMDEGCGRTIADHARNRHLTATGETWYINNRNKAVVLDGTAALGFPAGDLAASSTDNQAIELWFRADAQQQEAQLLQAGDNSLWLDQNGLLQFTSQDNTYSAGSQSLTDNEWHHLAINVLRAGNTAIYVDGQRVLTQSLRNIGTLTCDSLLIGARRTVDATQAHPYTYDRMLKGMVDEVRLWNATLDASTLSANRHMRLTGHEAGLAAYFPFETKTIDTGGQVQTVPTDTCMTASALTRKATYGHAPLTFTDAAPALQPKPTETNVDFTFTASNEKVVISINEAPAIIEGCTLNFKVKRVYDANGNVCDPVYWSAYVHRNSLSWLQDEATLTQELGSESTFTASLTNKGGTQQEWYLTGLPQWLRASSTSGVIDPLATNELTFTVAKSCPIGKHAETIYLVNADDIAIPLTLSLTVTGNVPDWAVDAGQYSSTMNLVGTIAVHGVPSNDTDDLLGAFVDGECRGVAHATYSKRYDEYFVLLDIACNAADRGKDVEFRLYDASTGITWPVVQASQEVKVSSGAMFGSFAAPVVLDALDRMEQTLALSEGWNWTSLSVVADDMTVPSVLAGVAGETCLLKSKTATMMLYNQLWDGDAITLNNRDMYKVLTTQEQQLTITGTRPDAQAKAITVRPGWNWMAYNETSVADLTDALAGLDPADGDLVKGKQGFAIYDGYEWSGSLEAMTPGQGYMYLSQASTVRTFNYPTTLRRSALARKASEQRKPDVFSPADDSRYPGNMTVVARVTYEGTPLEGQETGVFSGNECRTAAFTDADGIVFLTIPGSGADELTFRIPHEDQVLQATVTLTYEDDGVRGNRSTPLEIAFDRNSIATGLDGMAAASSQERWYTLEGILLTARPTLPGVYLRVVSGGGAGSGKVVIR